MNKFLSSIIRLICFLLLPLNAYAQIDLAQEDDLELNRRESSISEQLQSQIYERVSAYYDSESFLINVKTHLKRVAEKLTQPQASPPPSFDSGDLPGLPVSPKINKANPSPAEPKVVYGNKFRIDYVEVTALVDENAFTAKDISFIERVIKMHPEIDPVRGDRVKVSTLEFPKESAAEDKASEYSGIFKDKFFLIAALLTLLLLLSIVIQIIHMRRSKKEEDMLDLKQYKKETFISPAPIPDKLENKSELYYELRQLIVTTVIGNPSLSAKILKSWNPSNKDEDIYKIAGFLKATDPKLTEFLSEYLGTELTAKVEFAINQIQTIDKEDLAELFKKFREEYQNEQKAMLTDKSGAGDIFNFLTQLQPHQVFQMIKDEPLGIMAVVLAQVSPDVANEIISNLPKEIQQKLPVEIGKLKKIPISAYTDIAKNLSKKAVELDKIKYVTTDGVNALVEMLEQSSPELEEQLLASVAEQDIALADELSKVYISFDQLPLIPDNILSDVLRDISREDIIASLVDSKADVREKIINNLPPRTKIMVTDKLKSMQEEATAEEISSARRMITRKFRDLAKSGKLDLAKYTRV